jgi:hypothetical protein
MTTAIELKRSLKDLSRAVLRARDERDALYVALRAILDLDERGRQNGIVWRRAQVKAQDAIAMYEGEL